MLDCPYCNKPMIPNTAKKGMQIEARCSFCNGFIKWLSKKDYKAMKSLEVNSDNDDKLNHISKQLDTIIEILQNEIFYLPGEKE